jgi:tripeptide aminopeptidase
VRIAAADSERRELNDLFEALCRIESPSGRERDCAQRIGDELRTLGLDVHEDDAGPEAGSDCGNLLARIPASGGDGEGGQSDTARSILLCAHMDTVPLSAPVEPVLVDDGWENAGEGILGADNKAAVAVILAVARRAARDGLPIDVELLFTVSEERALAGARAFDRSQLRSDFGYVFDHATPIGEVIVASPSQYRLEATFHGAAAHAGMHPEKGRSAIVAAARAVTAMRLGRLDEETTANVGEIQGGSAMNVVPARCSIVAEARSLTDARVDEVVAEMVDHIHDAANLPECECDVDVSVQRMFQSYRVAPSAPALAAAERALVRCGYEPRRIASGGAADANAFQVQGLSVVNLANGTERAHEPTERVSVAALEGMLDVVLTLVDEAAR